jgi:sulfatase maturation enzyme AslB (radical SAM superfamily)
MNSLFSPFNGLKCLLYKNEICASISENLLPPVTVEVDPSNICNHNCKWCMFKDFRENTKCVISKNHLKDIIDQIKNLNY